MENSAVLKDGDIKLDGRTAKVVVLASLGSALEFYELIIYGVFAHYISVEFFPNTDPLTSLIATFGVFAVGYASRPLGGMIFAHFGDKVGRRGVFVVSILLMSFATIGIGLLPGYATIGILAPLLLILFRLIQGASIGGELAGAITYVIEMIPGRRGLVSGILLGVVVTGVFIANGVSTALHALFTSEQMQAYGWRIAFLIGGAVGLISYWVRKTLDESPEFMKIKSNIAKQPIVTMFGQHWRSVLLGIGTTGVLATFNGLFYAYMTPYLTRILKYDSTLVSEAMLGGILCYLVMTIVSGWLSDMVSRKAIFIVAALLLLIGAVPLYQALATKSINPFVALALAGLIAGPVSGTFAAILADLFPTNIRFSGVATAYGIGSAIFNGLAPVLAVYLINKTGNLAAPGYLMAGVALIGIVAASLMGKWTKPLGWWYGRDAANTTS